MAKRKPAAETLTDRIKRALAETGLSVNQIANESGIPQPVLQRFATGQRDIKLATADKLAAYLGLALMQSKGGTP